MSEKSPFKFLDSYTSDDKSIFFGREHETEELFYKILNAKQIIIYGSSGTGKTSLVQCGLASKFEDADWMPVLIRRGDNINTALKNTLSQIAVTPFRKAKVMADYIRSVYLDFFKPIYLIFDQFEELFIFGSDEEINQFIAELKECLSSDISCRFVFVVRGEYLENIARFEDSIPDFFENRMRVERMTRSNATRVISDSCKAFNIELTENFSPLLLDRLSPSKSTIELTYLQVYLDKLYKNATAKSGSSIVFDENLLKKSGMIEDVLSEFLDEQVANTKDKETAMTVLKSFVSSEGTKKPCTVSDVSEFCLSLGKKTEEEKISALLKQFVDLRILKDKDETGRYELRHDALANKIYEQISLGEKELIEVRQFFTNRFSDYQRRGVLLNEQDINYLTPYLGKLFLDVEQKQFVEKSQRSILSRRNRRRNIALIIGSFVLLILTGFSIVAMNERNAAIEQSKIAEQKTKEALLQKSLSEKAKEMALQASKEAMDAKSFAELQTKIADEQKKIAEQQSLEAKNQSTIANTQKLNALQQEEIAKQQSLEALKQKSLADSASADANRLRLISIGQNVALRSSLIKDDPVLSGLLACTSYRMITDNKGNLFDPQLYQALESAYQKLNPESTKSFSKFSSPIKSTSINADETMQLFCNDGSFVHMNSSGSILAKTNFTGAATNLDDAFFSPDGKYLITSNNDFSIHVWDVANPSASVFNSKENSGLIRAVAIKDLSLFAVAGRDSLVVIFENKIAQSKIHLPSRIRSLIFNNDYSVLYAGCEDGNIYSVNTTSKKYSVLNSIAGARVQILKLEKNYLIAGCSNGVLNFYDITQNKKVNEYNLGSSIEFVTVNTKQNMIVAGCSNHSVFYAYLMNDFSIRPLKAEDLNAVANNLFLLKDGTAIIVCDDNNLLKRNISCDWLYEHSVSLLHRDLTTEEWNEYIGEDVPYKKIIKP